MQARIAELEAQVAQLSSQRDELYRDIETLCISNSDGSPWSSSTVLMQRAVEAERQRDELASENATLKAEKASLMEDIESVRESKRQSDAYCREISTHYAETQKGDASTDRRRSRASCEKLALLDITDVTKEGTPFSELQSLYTAAISAKDAKLKEATERVAKLEEELVALAHAPDTSTLLNRANEEIALLHSRIQALEESLEKSNEQLEDAQHDARRNEHHVSTLLDELEKTQNEKGAKGSHREAKKARSLQKRLDRLSLDLTRAFSKMQSKEEALSETEAEMDSMKRRHKSDLTLVREAFDMKFQESRKLLAERDATIQALKHRLEVMELEKRQLHGNMSRKEHVLARLREARGRSEVIRGHALPSDRENEIPEYQRRIDGMEAKIRTLERTLHHVNLTQEATERQKNEALIKASGYKKKYISLRTRIREGGQNNGMPLVESNLQLHNFATEWEESLRQTRPHSGNNSRQSSRRTRSRTGSHSSRYSQVSMAQFALFALMMQSMGKQNLISSQ